MKKELGLKIRLTDIPDHGKSFHYSEKDAEAVRCLQYLLDRNPFQVQVELRPLNSSNYELKGSLQAKSLQQCSRCAEDFDYELKQNIHEILLPEMEVGRTERYAKTSTPSDTEGADFSSLSYDAGEMTFDLGEYLHEIVALAIPTNPAPKVVKNQCSICPKKVVPGAFDYDETTEDQKESPFDVLKNLKM